MTWFCSLQVFLFHEMRKAKFCQKFVNFLKVSPKFRPTRNAEDRKLQSYVTLSTVWLAPNKILIEKKMIYRFCCNDWLKNRSTQNPHVRDICDFFSIFYNYHRGSTRFVKDDLDDLENYHFQELKITFSTIVFYEL